MTVSRVLIIVGFSRNRRGAAAAAGRATFGIFSYSDISLEVNRWDGQEVRRYYTQSRLCVILACEMRAARRLFLGLGRSTAT